LLQDVGDIQNLHRFKAETGEVHEGKSTENYCRYIKHVWFEKSLSCKLPETGEYSVEVLLHDCPRLIFLPWHMLFWCSQARDPR